MALYHGENQKETASIYKTNRFLTPGKNIQEMAERIHRDDDLVRLLTKYTEDALTDPTKITLNDRSEVLTKRVKSIPLVEKDIQMGAYIIINLGSVIPMAGGLSYNISFDILCNVDTWELDGYTSRPMMIMNRIDAIFSDTKMKGIGKMQFLGAAPLKINDKIMGYTMLFNIGEIY